MLKTGGDRFWWITMFCLVQGAAAVVLLPFLPLPAPASWPYIAASAAIHVVYQFLLVRTYARGDFSQTYPIARGSAPMMVALGGFLLAGEHLSIIEGFGVVTVAAGIMGLAFQNGRFHWEAAPTAVLTGLSIAAYSVVDGIGGRLSHNALAYLAWMNVMWSPAVLAIYLKSRDWRSLLAPPPRDLAAASAGGIVAMTGYGIIIWAMTAAPMGLVSALRETSVVFAALLARVFLHERPDRYRVAACVVVACGAACLALG